MVITQSGVRLISRIHGPLPSELDARAGVATCRRESTPSEAKGFTPPIEAKCHISASLLPPWPSSPPHPASGILDMHPALVLCGSFLALYLVAKAFRIFIYPYYLSPLRHLPGPSVSAPHTAIPSPLPRAPTCPPDRLTPTGPPLPPRLPRGTSSPSARPSRPSRGPSGGPTPRSSATSAPTTPRRCS